MPAPQNAYDLRPRPDISTANPTDQAQPNNTEQVEQDQVNDPIVQDLDSLLVKRRNDNHSPGPVIRELVPSSHQRSELSNTILCIFSK